MACEHDDCYTCPYPDCISKKEPEKKKPGRKRIDPALKRQHKLEYQRRYNKEHKEKINEFMKKYYQEHEEEYRARERKNRNKKNENI